MSIRDNIKKVLFILLWCIAGTGGVALLVAAINKKNGRTCKGYHIEINGKGKTFYIDEKQILAAIEGDRIQKIAGKTIVSFDLRRMEEKLKKNAWIRDAQLFFDNNELLRINITEREPVARIFTTSGSSFFMDSSCVELPMPDKSALKLPVFTGFPSDRIRKSGSDSVLVAQLKQMSWYILHDTFWMADIEQINIKPNRTFQLVPLIGNHLIEFGPGEDYEKKFRNLLIFYREVLAKTGFDKYSVINIEYNGQVIGTRRGSNVSKSDSVQAMKNILQLIKSAQQLQVDTVRKEVKPLEQNVETEQTLTGYDIVADDDDSAQKAKGPAKKPLQKNRK
ncbi:MAG: hypothetical protein C5B59_18170 [Bacteroidetes bacterium]|nr:MAG: hypothetical protein C5B59_18170 [Bacteroidota bacterium]